MNTSGLLLDWGWTGLLSQLRLAVLRWQEEQMHWPAVAHRISIPGASCEQVPITYNGLVI